MAFLVQVEATKGTRCCGAARTASDERIGKSQNCGCTASAMGKTEGQCPAQGQVCWSHTDECRFSKEIVNANEGKIGRTEEGGVGPTGAGFRGMEREQVGKALDS